MLLVSNHSLGAVLTPLAALLLKEAFGLGYLG